MVFVDFSNPFLRRYLAVEYLTAHRCGLGALRRRLSALAEAASHGGERRPLAAVLDIDEVILCNIHMNSFHAPAGAQGPEPIDFYACDYYPAPGGAPWPREDTRLNPLLPGARELFKELRRLGVTPFLVTGRHESLRAETVENLVCVGLAGDGGDAVLPLAALASPEGGRLVMYPDARRPSSIGPWKEECRAAIDKTHRIIVNVGDQVSDLGRYGDEQHYCHHPFYHTP